MRPSGTLLSIAQHRFGSWRAALEAAGVEPLTRQWDSSSIAMALQARIDRGAALDGTTVRKEDPSLFSAVKNRFGDFNDVVARFQRSGRLPHYEERRRGRKRT